MNTVVVLAITALTGLLLSPHPPPSTFPPFTSRSIMVYVFIDNALWDESWPPSRH